MTLKRWAYLLWAVLLMAALVFGESYNEDRSWTTSFVFLGGDSTAASAYDTSYVELNLPVGEYRFNKLQYQANVTFGGMSNCTVWAQIQQGPGSHVAPYDTLQSFIVTGDSLYSTSGWDLIYTWAADSGKPDVRMRIIVRTDADDTGASAGEKVGSTYTVAHVIDAWGHD